MCHYSYIWHPKLLDIPHLNLFAKDLISRCSEADRAERTRNGWEIKEENGVREKEKRGGERWEKESVFPEKKSSRERSRLGLPSWRNTRSSLILSFSLFSSAQLPTSSQLRTFAASAFQLVFPFLLFFFFLFSPLSLSLSLSHSHAYVWKESFLFRGFSSWIPRHSRLPTTSIFDMHHYLLCLMNILIIYSLLFAHVYTRTNYNAPFR